MTDDAKNYIYNQINEHSIKIKIYKIYKYYPQTPEANSFYRMKYKKIYGNWVRIIVVKTMDEVISERIVYKVMKYIHGQIHSHEKKKEIC